MKLQIPTKNVGYASVNLVNEPFSALDYSAVMAW